VGPEVLVPISRDPSVLGEPVFAEVLAGHPVLLPQPDVHSNHRTLLSFGAWYRCRADGARLFGAAGHRRTMGPGLSWGHGLDAFSQARQSGQCLRSAGEGGGPGPASREAGADEPGPRVAAPCCLGTPRSTRIRPLPTRPFSLDGAAS